MYFAILKPETAFMIQSRPETKSNKMQFRKKAKKRKILCYGIRTSTKTFNILTIKMFEIGKYVNIRPQCITARKNSIETVTPWKEVI